MWLYHRFTGIQIVQVHHNMKNTIMITVHLTANTYNDNVTEMRDIIYNKLTNKETHTRQG